MALLTKYVDHAAADTTGDGSIGDPWKYIYQAMAAIKTDAGTNNFRVYLKSGESYGIDGTSPNPLESDDAGHDGAGGDAGAVLYIDQVGTYAAPNALEGYTTTPGDGGIATIDCAYDGANKLTNGINIPGATLDFWIFKNLYIINASNDGVEGLGTADNLTFKNVRVKSCGGMGFNVDNFINFENCIAESCTVGFDADNNAVFVACIARNNSSSGIITVSYPTIYNSLVYDNGDTVVIEVDGQGNVFGCTIDGNENGGKTSSVGIFQDSAVYTLNVANSIIYDCATGILADADNAGQVISRNNLFYGNTDNASAFQIEYNGGDGAPSTGDGVGDLGHVTGDPGFTGVYVPGANAQAAGLDAHFTNAFWADFDAAQNPPLQ